MISNLKPGDDALLVLTVPTLRLLAVRVSRVWKSLGGTERVEVIGLERDGARALRPGASFDRRSLIAVEALENLPASAPLTEAAASASGAA